MDASSLLYSLKNNPIALAISVVLHIMLFIMLGISLSSSEVPKQKSSNKETVKAYVVDAKIVEQEVKKLKQAENKKKKKIKKDTDKLKQQLAKEKKKLAKIKKEKKDLEQKAKAKKVADKKKATLRKKTEDKKKADDKKKAEVKRLADIRKRENEIKSAEVKRLADIQRKKDEIAAEKRRKIEEQELKLRMEEEERRLVQHNIKLDSLRSQYVKLIEQKVERNWLRPATVSSDYQCEVFVTQSILGDVIYVRLGSCANDVVFKNSIERAVRKSSPLPPPPNPEVFDREIRFVFKPDNNAR